MTRTIGLDAGHGINTYPPSKGVKGLPEHDFNQAVARVAKSHLEASGVRVVLGQPLNGRDVPLRTRTNLYDREKVDIIMSIHADFNGNSSARGFWGFYWHTSTNGRRLAQIWSKHLANESSMRDRGIQQSMRGSWTNFHMVREPKAPAVLMEHGFMSNSQDLAMLKSSSYRTQAGIALAKAACEYLGVTYRGATGNSTAVASASTSSSSSSSAPTYANGQSFAQAHPGWWDQKNDKIKDVQIMLKELGFYKGNIDSHFGQDSLTATRNFQEKYGISQNGGQFWGVPGPTSVAKMQELTKKVPPATPKVPSKLKPSDDKRWRLKTGTFQNAAQLKNAMERLGKEVGWILYERADSTRFNSTYRIYTGTFVGKNIAEAQAKRIIESFGWTIHVEEA